jgi:O-antigen ligase
VQNQQYTIAAAVSMLVFGVTLARVDFGIYILVIAMLLSPEIQAGAVGAHNERDVKFRYDDILIIVVFFGVLIKATFERRARLLLPSPVNAGILAYFAVCIVSIGLALRRNVEAWDPDVAAFVTLKMIEFYMVFFMVGMAINSRREIRSQLVVFFAVALAVSAFGIYSIGTLDRVSAPFETGGSEPNTLGGYLLLIICVAVALGYRAPSLRLKLLFFGIAAIALWPFMQTLSRASYAALGVALIVLGLAGRKPSLVALVILAFVFAEYVMPEEVIDRVENTFQEDGEHVIIAGKETDIRVDKSTHERIYIWEKVRFNLTVWPWFGGGISWETVLDSQYARVLIETGILGFAAFVFMQLRVLRTTWQAHRWSRDWLVSALALGTTAAMIGLVVHSFGTISFLIVRIAEPFWFLVALCAVGRSLAIEEHRELRNAAAQAKRAAPSGVDPNPLNPVPTPG